jgi:hypothetical protein
MKSSELGEMKPRPIYSPEFELGQAVFHRTVSDQRAGMVTGIQIRPGTILYLVVWPNNLDERYHYGIELSAQWCPHFGEDRDGH